jgi:hypothetical protein
MSGLRLHHRPTGIEDEIISTATSLQHPHSSHVRHHSHHEQSNITTTP